MTTERVKNSLLFGCMLAGFKPNPGPGLIDAQAARNDHLGGI